MGKHSSLLCLSIMQPWCLFFTSGISGYVESKPVVLSKLGDVVLIHASQRFDTGWKDYNVTIKHEGQKLINQKMISSKGLFKFPHSLIVGAAIYHGADGIQNSPWCLPKQYYHRFSHYTPFCKPIPFHGKMWPFSPPKGIWDKVLHINDRINLQKLNKKAREILYKEF